MSTLVTARYTWQCSVPLRPYQAYFILTSVDGFVRHAIRASMLLTPASSGDGCVRFGAFGVLNFCQEKVNSMRLTLMIYPPSIPFNPIPFNSIPRPLPNYMDLSLFVIHGCLSRPPTAVAGITRTLSFFQTARRGDWMCQQQSLTTYCVRLTHYMH